MLHKEIIILPVGGVRSIGANCTLYYYHGTLVLVDYGIGISSIDIYTPYESYVYDINNIFKYFKTQTLHLVITHIHEDHIGGVGFLIDNFKYFENIKVIIHVVGTLSKDVLNSRLTLDNLYNVDIVIHEANTMLEISNDLSLKFLQVDHSVPESYGVYLNIHGYRVFHTGDWNINQYVDEDIIKFENFESVKSRLETMALTSDSIKTFLELRNKCDLVVGESTKIGDANFKITEEIVSLELQKILKTYPKRNFNRIFITCFSSQINRVANIISTAMSLNMPVFIFGKSLVRVMNTGYFKNNYEKQFKHVKFINNYKELHNKEQGVYIVSGSQNEYNSVLYQLINYYVNFFNNRDLIIFASPIIPGAYKQIEMISDQLIGQKVKLLNVMVNNRLHASGHAYPDEIRLAYKIMQPIALLPVHGNAVKIQEHANLANEMRINAITLRRGEAISVVINKDMNHRIGKIKMPLDIEDLHVKIGSVFVRVSDNVVEDRRDLIKGGILIIHTATKDVSCFGAIIEHNAINKIKKEMDKYDLNVHKARALFIKRIKTKYSFYGLIKIIN